MELVKKNSNLYDVWLHWYVSERCYMDCEYCGGGHDGLLKKAPIRSIDIERLKQTLDCSGMTFRISFTGGGEPMLVPNLREACDMLTQKHYVSFNTNLVERGSEEFWKSINPERVVDVCASCHIKAVERRNMMDRFVSNYTLCKERGIPIRAVEVAYPTYAKEAKHYREWFAKQGVELEFDAFCGECDGKIYPRDYSEEEIENFRLGAQELRTHCVADMPYTPFCNAGKSVAVVKENGDVYVCDHLKVCLGNIYEGFLFHKHVTVCPVKTCICPLNVYDMDLNERAMQNDRWFIWWKRNTFLRFPGLYHFLYNLTGRHQEK